LSKLPVVSGTQFCKILAKLGYSIDHQTGSHIILRQKDAPHRRLTVPEHKELARGTLRSLIRQTGLTLDEFKQLVHDPHAGK
jgi:predicted RNA binding protein YcfA (HicA-like mRNA interferase family)